MIEEPADYLPAHRQLAHDLQRFGAEFQRIAKKILRNAQHIEQEAHKYVQPDGADNLDIFVGEGRDCLRKLEMNFNICEERSNGRPYDVAAIKEKYNSEIYRIS